MTHRLIAEHVVTPGGVLHHAVIESADDRLTEVGGPGPDRSEVDQTRLERVDGWVVPGFIDTHVHGGGGFDYAGDNPADVLSGLAFHARRGTTTSFASLVAAPLDVLVRQLRVLAELTAHGLLAGVHLEGPFLSPAQPGAHDPTALIDPDPASVERLLDAANGSLQMITLAPELPGAEAAITRFVAAGVRVAVGHTDADLDTVAAAVEAGADVATHLFNAMPAIHHRRPGPVPFLLNDSRVAVELIADGFHLHPQILRLAVAAAGADRVVLVTDAMVAAGMPDGRFQLGGLEVDVDQGMARLIDTDGGLGSIAGSTLTMADAFARMTDLVGDVAQVSAMASANAARHFGLSDVGRLEPGRRADLCVVDDHGGLLRVMRRGRWLTS